MPSFGQLMIDDYLRASQNYAQNVAGAGEQVLQQNQQRGALAQRQSEQVSGAVNAGVDRVSEAAMRGRQMDLQEQQIQLAHQDRQDRLEAQKMEQIAKSARVWGRSIALQRGQFEDNKVNAAWPDWAKEEAFQGYQEGLGMLSRDEYKSNLVANRVAGTKAASFNEKLKMEAVRQGVDLTQLQGSDQIIQAISQKKNYKDKLAAAKAGLGALFAQSYAIRGMSKPEQRAAAAQILKQAQIAEQDIENVINSQLSGSGQAQPVAPADKASDDFWSSVPLKNK